MNSIKQACYTLTLTHTNRYTLMKLKRMVKYTQYTDALGFNKHTCKYTNVYKPHANMNRQKHACKYTQKYTHMNSNKHACKYTHVRNLPHTHINTIKQACKYTQKYTHTHTWIQKTRMLMHSCTQIATHSWIEKTHSQVTQMNSNNSHTHTHGLIRTHVCKYTH